MLRMANFGVTLPVAVASASVSLPQPFEGDWSLRALRPAERASFPRRLPAGSRGGRRLASAVDPTAERTRRES
jgi:hypothetical protein